MGSEKKNEKESNNDSPHDNLENDTKEDISESKEPATRENESKDEIIKSKATDEAISNPEYEAHRVQDKPEKSLEDRNDVEDKKEKVEETITKHSKRINQVKSY